MTMPSVPWRIICLTAGILFVASSLRHGLLQSTAFDLAIFDQWIYLLSQNQPPLSSFLGFSVWADHGAVILYPVSLLYRLIPDVHWLLGVQAVALGLGGVPLWQLARQAHLSDRHCQAIVLAYSLYPALFNINFYADFRPESLAVPAMLWAVWAALERRPWVFALAIAVTLACKDTLSFTGVALGLWLALTQQRRLYGLGCAGVSLAWGVWALGYWVPSLRQGPPGGVVFYGSLGNSLGEVVVGLLTNPLVLWERVGAIDRLEYYALLLLPVALGLHWRRIHCLIPALPMVGLNILSDYPAQRDLIHHYSLPIFPFLLVWLVQSLAYRMGSEAVGVSPETSPGTSPETSPGISPGTSPGTSPQPQPSSQRAPDRPIPRFLAPKFLILWSCLWFVALGKYGYFWSRYLPHSSHLAAAYGALAQVPPQGAVLAPDLLCAHLSHRPQIHRLASPVPDPATLSQYQTIVLDGRHPDPHVSPAELQQLQATLATLPQFHPVYQQHNVQVFRQDSAPRP